MVAKALRRIAVVGGVAAKIKRHVGVDSVRYYGSSHHGGNGDASRLVAAIRGEIEGGDARSPTSSLAERYFLVLEKLGEAAAPALASFADSKPHAVRRRAIQALLKVDAPRPVVRKALEAMGHNVADGSTSYGGYQAIIRDPVSGVYFGASESRKDGQAAGY